MSERELTERAWEGDLEAFEELVRLTQSRVYALCLRMTRSREDALDLSQEAYLRAWRGLGQFQGGSSFSTWLYRLTYHVCVDFLRARTRREQALGQVASLDGEDAPLSEPPAPEAQQPERALERREREDALARAMARLEEHQREILILRETMGLSYREIAQSLGLEEGTVKSRIARARLALRTLLARDGNFFEHAASKPGKGGAPRNGRS